MNPKPDEPFTIDVGSVVDLPAELSDAFPDEWCANSKEPTYHGNPPRPRTPDDIRAFNKRVAKRRAKKKAAAKNRRNK